MAARVCCGVVRVLFYILSDPARLKWFAWDHRVHPCFSGLFSRAGATVPFSTPGTVVRVSRRAIPTTVPGTPANRDRLWRARRVDLLCRFSRMQVVYVEPQFPYAGTRTTSDTVLRWS